MIVQTAPMAFTPRSPGQASVSSPGTPQDLLQPGPPLEPPDVARFRRSSQVAVLGATAAGAAVGLLVPGLISLAPAMLGGLAGTVTGVAAVLVLHQKKNLAMKPTIVLACAAGAAGALAGVFLPMKIISVVLTASPVWVRPLAGAALWGGSALAAVKVRGLGNGLAARLRLHQDEVQNYRQESQTATEVRQALPEADVRETGRQVQIGGVVLKKKAAPEQPPAAEP